MHLHLQNHRNMLLHLQDHRNMLLHLQKHRNMLLIVNEKYSPKDEPPLELLARTTPNAPNKVTRINFQNQVEQEGTCAKERKKS